MICSLPPQIGYYPTSFNFSGTLRGNNPPSQTLSIENQGGGILNWSLSDNATWLNQDPAGGKENGSVTISVNSAGLQARTYLATIKITAAGATNSPVKIPVTLTITAPDLVETSVSDPPASAFLGSSFSITDTVLNQGDSASNPSKTRYYLSTDNIRGTSDRVLTGSRSIPGLASGATSTGTISVTIPSGIPLGIYYLLACADDMREVVESNETNNCVASGGTIQILAPDLVELSVSDPPPTGVIGTSFSVTDMVKNQGNTPAGASKTRYYLSTDIVKDLSDKLLTGDRSIPSLAPGANFIGTANVTIPSTTPTGTYYLLACADDLRTIVESNENNNCIASTRLIQVTGDSTITVTTLRSGRWSDTNPSTSPWPGGILPLDTHSIIVGNGYELIVDGNYHCAGMTTGTANNPNTKLTILNGKTLTVSGPVYIRYDATFQIGAGARLEVGNSPIYLGRCKLRSTATASNFARITGSKGTILQLLAEGNSKQDIFLSYVSFQNGGDLAFHLVGSAGDASLTNQLVLDHCVFINNGAIRMGSSSTPLTTSIEISNCDFRNLNGNIYISGKNGAAMGNRWFKNCTFYHSSERRAIQFLKNGTSGWQFQDCVAYHFSVSFAIGNVTFQDNLLALLANAQNGSNLLTWSENSPSDSTLQRNYIYSNYPNAHEFSSKDLEGTGTIFIYRNIFEAIYNTNSSNHIAVNGSAFKNIDRNLVIHSGILATCTFNVTSHTIQLRRNTIYQMDGMSVGGILWLSEGKTVSGSIYIANNLITGMVKGTALAGYGNNQTITYSDYNDFANVALPYGSGINVSSGQMHDLIGISPYFVDPSRNLSRWAAQLGVKSDITVRAEAIAGATYIELSGVPVDTHMAVNDQIGIALDDGSIHWTTIQSIQDANTVAIARPIPPNRRARMGDDIWCPQAALFYLLRQNGYSSMGMDQSGVKATHLPSDLHAWVSGGFVPTNPLLKNAGDPAFAVDNSWDIGAMDVQD